MNKRFVIFTFALVLFAASAASAQLAEIQLPTPQTKITTVSAMRARRAPNMEARNSG